MAELKGGGAGDVMGTLRERVIIVSALFVFMNPLSSDVAECGTKRIPGSRPTPSRRRPPLLPPTCSLPTAGGTAYNALFFGPLPLSPSMSILTHGTGGDAIFAIQLASALGVTVISTSSSPEKLDIAKQLKVKYLINYTEIPDGASKVLEFTGGKGEDHVINVGGSGTIFESLKAMRQGGLISVIGNLTGS